MALFIIGLVILGVGGFFYGKFVEKVFGPDDRDTPATRLADGVDYVEMPKRKNTLIELLNIAGTGPILGPIQGILFGPIAFLTIPIVCVIAGATHDYFVGMISMRNNGHQVPRLIDRYMGKKVNRVYIVIVCILMLLTGVVFIYTPGDLIVNDLLGMDVNGSAIWITYACILLYYIVATLFPIDKIIGKIYPIFGAILILSAIGIFIGVLTSGGADMHNITEGVLISKHPMGQRFIPIFFITVACGILSGFHGSQATLISRTTKSEFEGRGIFYNSMIIEGFIAMVWAAGAMIVFNRGAALDTNATLMVGNISRTFMGKIGGLFAVAGVIVLPITSGDTAFRSLRLMVAEQINFDQSTAKNRLLLALILFIPAVLILFFAKTNAAGFQILWRYFGFTNQLVAVFALALISVYLRIHGKNYLLTLIPGMFYAFIVSSYIASADIGLHLPMTAAYVIGVVVAILFAIGVTNVAKKRGPDLMKTEQ
ncbi:MAG: carbon starvation CstA family protein [Peptoniphilus sp.]|nr:carbon starvation CstA family protein [Peptoniphilus sp.]MDD7363151.1 carbon starvation CstA family protein [Bacillota bacterium]MDY6044525.1 carbon starvation CstA family protein [Peptoniphilus sp.]